MNKKKTFVLAVLVILVAMISTSTLAWFTATGKVDNEFLIAGSEDNGNADKIFSIDVYEFVDGVKEEEHTYVNILPGANLSKDVYVENTGAYDQYVRVEVTISDKKAWLDAAEKYGFAVTDVLVGYNPELWTHIWHKIADENAEEIVYVMFYKYELKPGNSINVFDSVLIPTQLTQEDAVKFGKSFTIDVEAVAVQTENVGAENVAQEDKAWTAYNYVMNN